jgi:AcrR family transcriptional regulator
VAEQLGISKKTLYQYWTSKDEIISALCDAAVADMQQQEETILAGDLEFEAKLTALLTVEPKRFGKINDWVIDDMRRHKPEEWQKVEDYRRSHVRHLQEFIAEGIRQRKLRSVNSAIAAQMILGACTEMLEYQFLRDNNLTITDALHGLTDIFLHGVLENVHKA